ncbi:hypothetical protein REG_0296 [Candidatus Regiella insecticola LSR1]|uniref:Secreted protein n=1 Tax=Candidatus Regiella insecticola LSR1 TaxID=663321 RepID=E0WQU9_9ENTR|nr:hypothetical protein [Candidatus Regiella insecticola]EFL92509.1 hypothetical protein REG_0296 [Candidatus Regiella insecticola LSR1]
MRKIKTLLKLLAIFLLSPPAFAYSLDEHKMCELLLMPIKSCAQSAPPAQQKIAAKIESPFSSQKEAEEFNATMQRIWPWW